MKNKVIDYFFDDDEMELVPMYSLLLKMVLASAVITILVIIL